MITLTGGWTIREVTPLATQVSLLPYHTAGSANAQPQPFRLTYKIGSNVFLPNVDHSTGAATAPPKLAWWNPKSSRWEDEGITDIK